VVNGKLVCGLVTVYQTQWSSCAERNVRMFMYGELAEIGLETVTGYIKLARWCARENTAKNLRKSASILTGASLFSHQSPLSSSVSCQVLGNVDTYSLVFLNVSVCLLSEDRKYLSCYMSPQPTVIQTLEYPQILVLSSHREGRGKKFRRKLYIPVILYSFTYCFLLILHLFFLNLQFSLKCYGKYE